MQTPKNQGLFGKGLINVTCNLVKLNFVPNLTLKSIFKVVVDDIESVIEVMKFIILYFPDKVLKKSSFLRVNDVYRAKDLKLW